MCIHFSKGLKYIKQCKNQKEPTCNDKRNKPTPVVLVAWTAIEIWNCTVWRNSFTPSIPILFPEKKKWLSFLKAVCPWNERTSRGVPQKHVIFHRIFVSSFIMNLCDQLFRLRPWLSCRITPHTVYLFCSSVFSVPIIQQAFPIPLPLFCHEILLTLRVWVLSQSLLSINTLTWMKLALPPFRNCSSSFDHEALYFHAISFKTASP